VGVRWDPKILERLSYTFPLKLGCKAVNLVSLKQHRVPKERLLLALVP